MPGLTVAGVNWAEDFKDFRSQRLIGIQMLQAAKQLGNIIARTGIKAYVGNIEFRPAEVEVFVAVRIFFLAEVWVQRAVYGLYYLICLAATTKTSSGRSSGFVCVFSRLFHFRSGTN